MVPLVQKELHIFREKVWNTHRIRTQKDTLLPDGVPEHIYNFPEQYDLDECGRLQFIFCRVQYKGKLEIIIKFIT